MRANGKCNNSHAPLSGLVGFVECISARFIFYHSILLLYYMYLNIKTKQVAQWATITHHGARINNDAHR